MDPRLYFDSDALQMRSTLQACLPNSDAGFDLYLQQTLFHPQGGGQPADQGEINGLNVLMVKSTELGIAHTVMQALPLGEVSLRVAKKPRQLHARLHSAGHILANVAELYGWLPFKAHHWPGEARVVLQATASARPLNELALADEVNANLRRGLARTIHYQDGRRMIAFGDFSAYPCGGTHVQTSLEVGQLTIGKIKLKHDQLSITYGLVAA